MGKKIVISESQYRRVFLNEQYDKATWNPHIRMWTHPAYSDYPVNVPKEYIYIKNSDGTFSPKYPNDNNIERGYVSKDDSDIIQQTMDLESKKFQETLNKHIKNRESGNKFREWVRDDVERLKYVDKELKKNNLTGTLDATGDHTNEYIKIAWGLLGRKYLINPLTKKDIENEFIDWRNENPTYGDYSQIKDISYAKVLKNEIRNSNEYKNYISALNNRKKIKSIFGWTDSESISSADNLVKILSGKVPSSTCINPESLILDLTMAKNSIQQYDENQGENSFFDRNRILNLTSGGWNKGATSKYYTSWRKDSDLENRYKEYKNKERELRIECPVPQRTIKTIPAKVDNTYHTANELNSQGITDFNNINKYRNTKKDNYTNYINYKSQKQFDGCQKKMLDLSNEYGGVEDEYNKYLTLKKQQQSTEKELKSMGFEVNETTLMDVRQINQLLYVLEQVNIHNLIIGGQSSQKEKQLCDNIVYGTDIRYETRRQSDGLGSITMEVPVRYNKTFSWESVCKNRGGVMTYPLERKTTKGSATSIGWVSNQGYCMCVRNNEDVVYGKKIHEWAKSNDTRNWYDPDRIADAVKDCATDWHCVLDIVSIAAYAFGPVGALVSGIVDAISAIGYVIEGDEGWKMNAGLTALGMFGIGEGISLAKKGVKFSNKLNDLGGIISKHVDDVGKVKNAFKLEREIAEWTKGLSEAEKKLYKDFKKLNSKIGDEGGRKFLDEINKKIKDLPNANKGTLKNMFDDLEPDDMKKLFDESGGDLLKMTNKYSKGVRGAVIQGGLFVTLYGFSDEMGKSLVNWCKNYGVDPLGLFDENCNPINKVDTPEELDISFEDILSKDESYLKSVKKQIESISPSTPFDGEDYLFSEEMINYRDTLKNLIEIGGDFLILKDNIKNLHSKLDKVTYNRGLDVNKINKKINIVLDIYKKINSLSGGEKVEDLKKLIDSGINKLDDIKGDEIDNKTKEAILQTGNPEISTEEVDIWGDVISGLTEKKKEQKDMEIEENKLNEQISRIKSLFGNSRLYGNIINEQGNPDTNGDKVIDSSEFTASGDEIDEPEAKSFLQSLGYVIKGDTKDDLCLREGSDLRKVYNKVKDKTNIGFMVSTDTKIGCVLSVYSKGSSPILKQISLFEGPTGNRFNMLFKIYDSRTCCLKDFESVFSISSTGVKFNAFTEGFDNSVTPRRFGVGLRVVKVDGTWKVDSDGNIILEDGVVVKLLNKKYNGVITKAKFSVGSINVNKETPGFTNTGTERGGNMEWMDNGSGSCITIDSWVSTILGSGTNSNFNLEELINNKM